MTIILLVLDFLISNLTSYNFHLVVLSLLYTKKFYPILIYFLMLSFFEYKYFFNLLILYILFLLNKKLARTFRDTALFYFIRIIIFYAIYLTFCILFKNVF